MVLGPIPRRTSPDRFGFNRAAAIDMATTMHEVVDEGRRGRGPTRHRLRLAQGGTVHTARTAPQLARAPRGDRRMAQFGFGEADYRFLDRQEAAAMVSAEGVLEGRLYAALRRHRPTGTTARVAHRSTRSRCHGGRRTAATSIEPGRVTTERGVVTARHVIRATEAYTSQAWRRGPDDRTDLLVGDRH